MITGETRLSVDCEWFYALLEGLLEFDKVVDLYIRHKQRQIRLILFIK